MSYVILIVTGLIVGLVLGEAISVLHYAIKIKRKEEKRYDRDYKNAQSNEKGDTGLYPVSPKEPAGSGVPGSSADGKTLDITQELAVYSRNVLTQYCNSQGDCEKCCLERDGGCSLISGPPCMWTQKEGGENA